MDALRPYRDELLLRAGTRAYLNRRYAKSFGAIAVASFRGFLGHRADRSFYQLGSIRR